MCAAPSERRRMRRVGMPATEKPSRVIEAAVGAWPPPTGQQKPSARPSLHSPGGLLSPPHGAGRQAVAAALVAAAESTSACRSMHLPTTPKSSDNVSTHIQLPQKRCWAFARPFALCHGAIGCPRHPTDQP